MRMKNNEATGTDNLLCFKYGEKDLRKMTEIVTKVSE